MIATVLLFLAQSPDLYVQALKLALESHARAFVQFTDGQTKSGFVSLRFVKSDGSLSRTCTIPEHIESMRLSSSGRFAAATIHVPTNGMRGGPSDPPQEKTKVVAVGMKGRPFVKEFDGSQEIDWQGSTLRLYTDSFKSQFLTFAPKAKAWKLHEPESDVSSPKGVRIIQPNIRGDYMKMDLKSLLRVLGSDSRERYLDLDTDEPNSLRRTFNSPIYLYRAGNEVRSIDSHTGHIEKLSMLDEVRDFAWLPLRCSVAYASAKDGENAIIHVRDLKTRQVKFVKYGHGLISCCTTINENMVGFVINAAGSSSDQSRLVFLNLKTGKSTKPIHLDARSYLGPLLPTY